MNERPSKIERMFAEVEYDKLLQLLEVLKSEERIKAFEQSLAADIDNELQVYAFCSIAQDDKYHTNHILASHLQAAGIPTEQGILIPIFNMSMCTAIRPGEVWAYGSFDPNHEGEKRRLELLSE